MARVDTAFKTLRARHLSDNVSVLSGVFADMQDDVKAKHESGARQLVSAHWDKALADVIFTRNKATARDVALRVVKGLAPPKRAADDTEYDPDVMDSWLTLNAGFAAEGINAGVESDIAAAADMAGVDDPVSHVFGILLASGVAGIGQQMVTKSAGFGAHDAAVHVGAQVKVWQVNSRNPRSSHIAVNGQSVAMSENFSNGMAWPGDPAGGADENARCKCSLTIVS